MLQGTLIILLVVILRYSLCKYFIIGPTQVRVLEANECPEPEYKMLPMKMDFIFHDYNKTTQLLDVNLTVPVDFDETVGVFLKSGRKEKNKIQQNAFTLADPNACGAMNRYIGVFWSNIQQALSVPHGCPMKKGNYSMKNVYLNLDDFQVKMFFEGTFETRIQFKQEEKVIFCKDFVVQLSPKI